MHKRAPYNSDTVLDLIERALNDLDRTRQTLAALYKQVEQGMKDGSALAFKNDHGRLTEAGVHKLRSLIDAGAPDSEIARELEVTQPAVMNHRRRYVAETTATPPRRRRQ